jgi:ATP-binding cassette subfamily B protein
MGALGYLNKYFWKYRYRLLVGVLCIALQNWFQVKIPGQVKHSIEIVLKSVQQDGHAVNFSFSHLTDNPVASQLTVSILFIFGFAILQGVFMFFMRQTIVVTSRKIEFDLKNEMYQHYQALSTAFYKRNNTGDLMSRITEDVNRVRDYLGPSLMYIINLCILVPMVVVKMFSVNASLTAFVLLPLPILSISIYYVNSIVNKRSTAIQEKLSDITSFAQESYSGVRVVKSYVQEDRLVAEFSADAEDYKTKALRMTRVEALWFPLITLLIGLSNVMTLLIGGVLEIQGKISAGTIAEFMLYVNQITFPVSALGWASSMVQRANASQVRINEFLKTKPEIVSGPESVQVEGANIQFDKVSFTYPETGIEALKDISFNIKAGEKWAIVGKTGSGKSTLAELILRLYDPSSGEIIIGDKKLTNINLGSYREQLGYVPQEVFLFSDTIENNILFGGSEREQLSVQDAAKAASIDHEIESFPAAYQTIVGERGVTLSGGQKQRISIARALVKNPSLVVLDDCLSAVDAQTEKLILDHLYAFLHQRTSVIITHRIFSLMEFDQILVLKDGRIAEKGTHQRLLAAGGIYKEMYEMQQIQQESGLNSL